eukprot:1213186-Pyramimonas_sp.AAC.1
MHMHTVYAYAYLLYAYLLRLVLVLEELGVRGSELDKLLADIHVIAVGKADVCIQTESLSHEDSLGPTQTGADYLV